MAKKLKENVIIFRYHRDLKKREEAFLNEIEIFQVTESRLMTNLRYAAVTLHSYTMCGSADQFKRNIFFRI